MADLGHESLADRPDRLQLGVDGVERALEVLALAPLGRLESPDLWAAQCLKLRGQRRDPLAERKEGLEAAGRGHRGLGALGGRLRQLIDSDRLIKLMRVRRTCGPSRITPLSSRPLAPRASTSLECDVEASCRLAIGSLLHHVRQLVCQKAFTTLGVRLMAPLREHHMSPDRVCIGVNRVSRPRGLRVRVHPHGG